MQPDSSRRSNKPDAEWIDNQKCHGHDRGMRLEVRRDEMQILKDDHFADRINCFYETDSIYDFSARREFLEAQ